MKTIDPRELASQAIRSGYKLVGAENVPTGCSLFFSSENQRAYVIDQRGLIGWSFNAHCASDKSAVEKAIQNYVGRSVFIDRVDTKRYLVRKQVQFLDSLRDQQRQKKTSINNT